MERTCFKQEELEKVMFMYVYMQKYRIVAVLASRYIVIAIYDKMSWRFVRSFKLKLHSFAQED